MRLYRQAKQAPRDFRSQLLIFIYNYMAESCLSMAAFRFLCHYFSTFENLIFDLRVGNDISNINPLSK